MSIIKHATKELHEDLELLPFNQKMFRGEQTKEERADYLLSWYEIFKFLDPYVPKDIQRVPHVCYDLDRYPKQSSSVPLATYGYLGYLEDVCPDLNPHIYVNYMGLMYGGQLMKKRYPHWDTELYTFENIEESRRYIREDIIEDTDNFILGAKSAFTWHIAIVKELGDKHGL